LSFAVDWAEKELDLKAKPYIDDIAAVTPLDAGVSRMVFYLPISLLLVEDLVSFSPNPKLLFFLDLF